jgi:hypothetical protein
MYPDVMKNQILVAKVDERLLLIKNITLQAIAIIMEACQVTFTPDIFIIASELYS